MPSQSETYNDIKIGQWLNVQKYRNSQNNLKEKRKEKLESLDSNIFEKSRNTWDDNYELLKEFIDKFNRLPKVNDIYKDIKIGVWLRNQKYRNYKVNNYRRQKLESIGVKFD